MIGISAAGIHAPSVNLETTTTSAMIPVATAPMALMASSARQLGSFSLRWWRTIPAWLRVKPVKTPNAYSGISAEMSPLKTMIKMLAIAARKITPFENTNRAPRLKNWRGR